MYMMGYLTYTMYIPYYVGVLLCTDCSVYLFYVEISWIKVNAMSVEGLGGAECGTYLLIKASNFTVSSE